MYPLQITEIRIQQYVTSIKPITHSSTNFPQPLCSGNGACPTNQAC